MQEIWKNVVGYEGIYEVSNLGNVRSLDRTVPSKYIDVTANIKGKQLKPIKNKYGYLRVNLCNDSGRKSKFVHRLVAMAFIENPNNFPQINHKDENKLNNSVENLEWCSAKYNCNYGSHNLLCSLHNRNKKGKPVIGINTKGEIITFPSMREAERNGFNARGVWACCNGRQKTHKGYEWRVCNE